MAAVSNGTTLSGQFTHPIIDKDTESSDAWKREYNQPPPLKRLVQRMHPLVDVRPLLKSPGYTPDQLLKSHGFGVVKQDSPFLAKMRSEVLDKDAVTNLYHPEIQRLVCEVTGAKRAFVTVSVLRQGKRNAETYKLPVKLSTAGAHVQRITDSGKSNGDDKPTAHELAGQTRLGLAAPVRVPHLDFTPLGARQTVRSQTQEIRDAAAESGVLAFEDAICQPHGIDTASEAANPLIAECYNRGSQLGPRYAAYSIWRPLRTVERDPLTLAPRNPERPREDGERVYWPYLNKVKGPAELGGDFLKEFAMLGVQTQDPPAEGNEEDDIKFYYVSSQQPDEVLFIKLFDSAALGPNAEHASAPWHASPEIGDAQGSEPRESIDARVVAFW